MAAMVTSLWTSALPYCCYSFRQFLCGFCEVTKDNGESWRNGWVTVTAAPLTVVVRSELKITFRHSEKSSSKFGLAFEGSLKDSV